MKPFIPSNLRINADDFGLTPSISNAIVSAAKEGYINSVSIVPFSDGETETLLQELRSIPGIHLGAHLAFLEIPLLTRPSKLNDGIPPRNFREFIKAYVARKISPTDVYQEWKAQVELLRTRLGETVSISHLDSHQHLHLLPKLFEVAVQLKAEFHIPLLRVPKESSLAAYFKDPPFGIALQGLALKHSQDASETFFGIGTSMHFRAHTYRNMVKQIRNSPNRKFELMVHLDESERGRREFDEIKGWLHFFVTP